jgi:hypothetical protein
MKRYENGKMVQRNPKNVIYRELAEREVTRRGKRGMETYHVGSEQSK